MSGADRPAAGSARVDEFDQIERLFRPLTGGDPAALRLLDDAAVLRPRAGMDLVLTKDAMVEGVHFLPQDPLDLVARKLLRANLSDMAAMAAEPFAYLLAVAWPPQAGWPQREAFAAGLRQDQDRYGVVLLGGDTVSTPGPLTASVTLLGWVPEGRAALRSGAKPGDRVLVSGTIGDGGLGLQAAQGRLAGLPPEALDALAGRYRLPEPRLSLTPALRAFASAAADVSDGLIADAGRIALASGAAVTLHLDRIPLSPSARAWLGGQGDAPSALAALAAGGDDYEIVCTAPAAAVAGLQAAAAAAGVPLAQVGEVSAGEGVEVRHDGRPVNLTRTGWVHP